MVHPPLFPLNLTSLRPEPPTLRPTRQAPGIVPTKFSAALVADKALEQAHVRGARG